MSTELPPQEPRGVASPLMKRVLLVALGALVLYLLVLAAAAYYPRWWAQRIGTDVDGQVSRGVMWGLFYGFGFTAVPLLVLAQARRRIFSWPGRIALAAVAIVLAVPNLLTASIVWGTGTAAHAGERILDVEAPGFRGGTLVGVIAAVVLVVAILWASINRSRLKAKLEAARAEVDASKRKDQPEDEPPA